MGGRAAEELHDVTDHAPVARACQQTALREHVEVARRAVFQRPGTEAGGKAHVAGGKLHPEVFEHGNEQRIGLAVAHDEAGIDSTAIHDLGAGVTAGTVLCFENRDIVMARQEPCGREARDSTADDGSLAVLHLAILPLPVASSD